MRTPDQLDEALDTLTDELQHFKMLQHERAIIMSVVFKQLLDLHDMGDSVGVRSVVSELYKFYTGMSKKG